MTLRFKYRQSDLEDILNSAATNLTGGCNVCGYSIEGLLETYCEENLDEDKHEAFIAHMNEPENAEELYDFARKAIEELHDNNAIDLYDYDYNEQYGEYENYCCEEAEARALGGLQ